MTEGNNNPGSTNRGHPRALGSYGQCFPDLELYITDFIKDNGFSLILSIKVQTTYGILGPNILISAI